MRFLSGVICGVLLTIVAAFIADSATGSGEPSQRIVNWDVAGDRVSKSLGIIREELHDATR
jgi:hypothetical protein